MGRGNCKEKEKMNLGQMENMKLYLGGRMIGRQYEEIMKWIIMIKSGKEVLLIGKDYVAMSRKKFDDLNNLIKELKK